MLESEINAFFKICVTSNCVSAVCIRSPGFGLCLVAESTTGVMLAVDQTANEKSDSQDHSLPEELGQKTAMMLLDEIWRV